MSTKRPKRHPHLTGFNGYVLFDPEVKEGGDAVLDAGGVTECQITVIRLDTIYATVTAGIDEWRVVRNRITRKLT